MHPDFSFNIKKYVQLSDNIKCLMTAWGYLVWMYHNFVLIFNQFPMNAHLRVYQFCYYKHICSFDIS